MQAALALVPLGDCHKLGVFHLGDGTNNSYFNKNVVACLTDIPQVLHYKQLRTGGLHIFVHCKNSGLIFQKAICICGTKL